MRLLLDTQVALWALTDSPRLSVKARTLIQQPENDIYFSSASVWEIAIKHRLARRDMPVSGAEAAKPKPTAYPTINPTGMHVTTAYRYKDIQPIVKKRCTECHEAPSNYKDLIGENYVTPSQPGKSDLLGYADDESMRASTGKMTAAEKKMTTEWILAGAPER